MLCGDDGQDLSVGEERTDMMSAVLTSCAGPKGDVLREARKTIQLLKELALPGGDELGQPISRAMAFSIIRC
eukprot:387725-Pleurochrysis_carterae.AAC.1